MRLGGVWSERGVAGLDWGSGKVMWEKEVGFREGDVGQ
jgi:hypothetical protein